MTDVQGTPNPPKTGGGGIKGFMKSDTAGMPNWVWLLVIAGGITLAIGIKMYASKKSTGNATTTGTTPDSGLGLAIDPTTGLPYAVEGLVPAGGTAGGTQGQPGPVGPTGPQGPTGPAGTQGQPTPTFWLGHIPLFSKVWEGGVNTGGNGLQRWWFTPQGGNGQTEFDVPIGTRIWQGGSGRWWYQLPNGKQTQLTGMSVSAGGPSSTLLVQPSWPGDTTQTRISA